jgi:aldose sugar dehydrogenase
MISRQLIIFAVFTQFACAQQKDLTISTPSEIKYTTEEVVGGIDIPWGMEFLPDGSMLVTEISGKIFHVKDGMKKELLEVPKVYHRGQGGMLDIKLHPEYSKNGWIYFCYSSPDGDGNGGNTAVMRARLMDNTLTDKELLYKGSPNTTRPFHFGSRIVFDNDGYLYFAIGDRGDHFVNPQDITKDGGKIYRLHDDGRIPEDNPFVQEKEAKKAIWTYGHRNPQGMVKHPETGEIWTHEHGPQGGDEINILTKGKNYGWPVISYGINYDGSILTDKTEMPGMEQPLYYWVPSIAPSGMAFVASDIYPEWKHNLLVGSLRFQYLERLVIENNKVTKREKILENIGRLRNVKMGPDGYIYVGVEGKGILKIVPVK